MISRNTKRLIVIICIIAIIPAVAYATKSRNAVPKTKTNVQEIQKLVENKTESLPPFPKGEAPKPTVATPPKPAVKPAVKIPTGTCVDWIRQAGISDIASAYTLIMRESGCRVNATNRSSGAYGLPQSLPAGKMASAGADWRTNPVTQLRWFNSYCISRYGSISSALRHSNSYGWY